MTGNRYTWRDLARYLRYEATTAERIRAAVIAVVVVINEAVNVTAIAVIVTVVLSWL